MTDDFELNPGTVVWTNLDPVRGREQSGHRPVVVVSSEGHLRTVTTMAMVVPVTTRDRGWANHIALPSSANLSRPSWAMSEQFRSLTRQRMTQVVGIVDERSLALIRRWLGDFLGLTRF